MTNYAGAWRLFRSLAVHGRVRRRDLYVRRGGVVAAVQRKGGQGVLEAIRPFSLLLLSHHHCLVGEPGPGHLRLALRPHQS